jgi:hypothetical protein
LNEQKDGWIGGQTDNRCMDRQTDGQGGRVQENRNKMRVVRGKYEGKGITSKKTLIYIKFPRSYKTFKAIKLNLYHFYIFNL